MVPKKPLRVRRMRKKIRIFLHLRIVAITGKRGKLIVFHNSFVSFVCYTLFKVAIKWEELKPIFTSSRLKVKKCENAQISRFDSKPVIQGSVTFLNLRKILRACKGFSSFNGINSTLFEITQSYENSEPFLYLKVTDLLSFFAQILEMISTRIVVPWLPSKWRWLEIFYFKLKTPICLISVFRDGLFYRARKCLLFLQLIYHINQLTKGRSRHRCI